MNVSDVIFTAIDQYCVDSLWWKVFYEHSSWTLCTLIQKIMYSPRATLFQCLIVARKQMDQTYWALVLMFIRIL